MTGPEPRQGEALSASPLRRPAAVTTSSMFEGPLYAGIGRGYKLPIEQASPLFHLETVRDCEELYLPSSM